MNGLLGFFVLSFPMWIFLGILIGLTVAVWLARRWADARGRNRKKAMLIAGAIFLLPLFGDAILARLTFFTLCATQGGYKIYENVELPAEYWNEDGSPRFILPNGNLTIVNRFSFESEVNLIEPFRIAKVTTRIVELQSNDLKAIYTKFRYSGGWLGEIMSPTGSGIALFWGQCPTSGTYGRSITKVFVQQKHRSE